MKRVDEILTEGGQTFKDHNAVYGDNWTVVGNAMEAFFPNGVTLKTADDHNRFHIFMLKIVKLSRYALNWEKGGHQDSIHDDMVYAAMLEMIDAGIKERRTDNDAIDSLASQMASAIFFGVDLAQPGSDRTIISAMGAGSWQVINTCDDCKRPEECFSMKECRNEKASGKVPCDKCVTTEMCTQEEHCDRVANGYG